MANRMELVVMLTGMFTLFLIYLFYGAAFFAIGVGIVSRLKTFSKLRIAGFFSLLALFAFSHALHEWLEMFLFLELPDPLSALRIRQFSLFLLLASFLFLAFFAVNLHRVLHPASRPWLLGFLTLPLLFFLGMVLGHNLLPSYDFLTIVNFSIRKFLAIPATLLTGSGFILYARRLRALSRRGAGNFTGAGLAFLAYGVLTGLFTSEATILQLPIQFWRGLTAFVILHFIMYALNLFLDERETLINERLRRSAQAEKLGAIGRLAAGIAHEVNNPLANASLQLEMLRKDPAVKDLPTRTLERVTAIERSVEKSSRIAAELLLLADQRRESADYEAVELRSVVAAVWGELAERKELRNHRLLNQLPASLNVYGIALKLEQLFHNLLRNALDAMPAGGTITVYGREEEDRILVKIGDQGPGVAPAERSLALEPFFTTKEVGKGTGLGLAIAHGIMAQHHGSLELGGGRNGEGALVTLSFPGGDHPPGGGVIAGAMRRGPRNRIRPPRSGKGNPP